MLCQLIDNLILLNSSVKLMSQVNLRNTVSLRDILENFSLALSVIKQLDDNVPQYILDIQSIDIVHVFNYFYQFNFLKDNGYILLLLEYLFQFMNQFEGINTLSNSLNSREALQEKTNSIDDYLNQTNKHFDPIPERKLES